MYRLALGIFKQSRFKNISLSLLFLFWGVVMTFLTALFFVNSSINLRFEVDNQIEDFRFQNTLSMSELNQLSEEYHFNYIKRQVINSTSDNQTTELLSYNSSQAIDKPILISGRSIKASDEVMLYKQSADSQKVQLNDSIFINNKSFKVVGLFELPDYFNSNFLATGKKISDNDLIAFVDDSYFDSASVSSELVIGRYKNSLSSSDKEAYSKKMFKNNSLISFTDRDSNTTISLLSSKIKIYKLLFVLILTILGNILAILLGLLVYSYMVKNKKDTGVLLANGFRKIDIFTCYQLFNGIIIWPSTFVGSLLGILLFHFVQPLLNSGTSIISYYTVWPIYLIIIGALFLFHIYFSVVCTIVPYVIFIRKNIVEYFRNSAKVFKTRKSDDFYNKLPLKTRFKLKIALKNKLIAFIVFFAIFSAFAQGIMMMIFYNLPSSALQRIEESINYSQVVYTSNSDYSGQYFSQKRAIITEGKQNQMSQVLALKSGKNLKLVSAKGQDLNEKVSQKKVVVNAVLANSLKVHVGDSISLNLNNKTIDGLTVAGISNLGSGSYLYVDYDYFVKEDYISKGFTGFYANKDDQTDYGEKSDVNRVITAQTLIQDVKDNTKNLKLVGRIMLVSGILIPIALLSVSIAYLNDQTGREQRILFRNGFSRKALIQLVFRVYDPMILIGAVSGIVYTYFLFTLIFSLISKSTQTYYSVSINYQAILAALVLTIGTYLLSVFLVSRKKYKG